jgi:hypothetical protein
MGFELAVAVVVIALDGGVFDGSVHAFHLAISPGVLDFGQPVSNAVFTATHVEHVGHVCCCRPVNVAWWKGKLDTVVGQNRMDFVRKTNSAEK